MSFMEPIKPASQRETSALPDFVMRHFERQSDEYDHRQLYRILQTGIRQSELSAGLKLPPTREMASALGIARNTVVQVYEQLALEGFVQAGVGRGTYVADTGAQSVDRAAALPRRRGTPLSRRGRELVRGASASPLQWGAFTPGVPEVRMFPATVWSRLQAQAWREATPCQLSYATGSGSTALCKVVAEYLQSTRGVLCTPEQVVITSGTQQALSLVAQLLADPGDAVWLEDPGYWGARSVFRAAGLTLQPVSLDGEGLAPTRQQWQAPPRLMFLSPSHQYPTGALMSHGRRRQLLDYAAMHRVWIIEDDYDSEFRYDARPLPALQGLDEHNRVIYLGTFSKTLFPALRLSYLVLPSDLVDSFARTMRELFREGQTLQQLVLARFIGDGHYAKHIRRMRTVYAGRRATLIEAIRARFGQRLCVAGGDAGLHLVLCLPDHVDDDLVARDALQAGVMTRPLSLYFLQRPVPSRGLVLGYGSVPCEEIVRNFDRLARVIEAHL